MIVYMAHEDLHALTVIGVIGYNPTKSRRPRWYGMASEA